MLARAPGRTPSETLNDLIRAGLAREPAGRPFVQRTARMGLGLMRWINPLTR